jgi:hypothetical protein
MSKLFDIIIILKEEDGSEMERLLRAFRTLESVKAVYYMRSKEHS